MYTSDDQEILALSQNTIGVDRVLISHHLTFYIDFY